MTKLKDLETPVFQAEPIYEVTRDEFTLEIKGLVDKPKTLAWEDLWQMSHSSVDARLTSVSGFSVRMVWNGILWSDFLNTVKLKPQATHVTFTSRGGYDTTVSLVDLQNPRVLLCWGVAGELLEVSYGAPLRMFIPNLWGYKSCKWLAKIEFTDKMHGGFWEDRGYTRSGRIEAGTTFDVNTKTNRQIKGGEVTEF